MNWFNINRIRSNFTWILVMGIILFNQQHPWTIARYLGLALLFSIGTSLIAPALDLAVAWCEKKGLTYGDLVKWLRKRRAEKLTAGKG